MPFHAVAIESEVDIRQTGHCTVPRAWNMSQWVKKDIVDYRSENVKEALDLLDVFVDCLRAMYLTATAAMPARAWYFGTAAVSMI